MLEPISNTEQILDPLQVAGRLLECQVNVSTTGELIVAVAGKTIRIFKLYLQFGGTNSIHFESNSVALNPDFNANSGDVWTLDKDGEPWFTGSAGQNLSITVSAAQTIKGILYYTQQ